MQSQSMSVDGNNTDSNKNKFKVLICSPSNGGCDEITRRLIRLRNHYFTQSDNPNEFSIVRVGRSESMNKDCASVNLDSLWKSKLQDIIHKKRCNVSQSLIVHNQKLLETEQTLKKKISLLEKNASNKQNTVNASANTNVHLIEMKCQLEEVRKKIELFRVQMMKVNVDNRSSHIEVSKDQLKAKECVLNEANFVICTLAYCGNSILNCLSAENNKGISPINVLIVDEASQCLEVDLLIPLRFGCNRIIQVGDPEQLPATVLSKRAQETGLSQSLFERVYQRFRFTENNPIKMLYIQYRMHPHICSFPSIAFYKAKLKTDVEIEKERTASTSLVPYRIYDLTESKEVCEDNNNSGSIYNPIEAKYVITLCESIQKKNYKYSIGIITPYQRQVQYIKELLSLKKLCDNIEIGTVDSYQGREKDVIVLSCVRSNSSGAIGFLNNRQRLNVSLTRAKYGMYIVCNVNTLNKNEMWKLCFDDAKMRNLIKRNEIL
jgi:senataxin